MTHHSRTLSLALLLATQPFAGAPAQRQRVHVPDVGPGVRIRVRTLHTRRERGTVVSSSRAGLAYVPDGSTDTVTVPLAIISTLDVSGGRQQRFLHYLGIGAAIGGAAGAIVAGAAYRDSCKDSDSFCFFDFGRGFDIAAGLVLGGLGGAIVGGTVGVMHRPEKWYQVDVGNYRGRLTFMPYLSPGREWRTGVAISLAP